MEMKIYKLLSVILGSAMSFAFSSCENASNSFPDYEGGVSVYFAYQYPVRTICRAVFLKISFLFADNKNIIYICNVIKTRALYE